MEIKQLRVIRLANQGLLHPFEEPTEAIERIVGIQSQQPQTAWLNWGLHTQNTNLDTIMKMAQQQQIVRAWGQRWTLHLFSLADFQLVVNARSSEKIPAAYFLGQKDQILAVGEVIKQLLQQHTTLMREDVLIELHQQFPTLDLDGRFIYVVLQVLTMKGYLYFDATSSTQNWRIIATKPQKGSKSVATLIRRYLKGFGPASLTDFVRWSGIKVSVVRPLWESIAKAHNQFEQSELVSLRAYSPSQLQALADELETKVLIAAPFDASLTGYADKNWLMKPEMQKVMWTKNGILRAPIIINGDLTGYWTQQIKKNYIQFTINHWLVISKTSQNALKDKLTKIAQFQGSVPKFTFKKMN